MEHNSWYEAEEPVAITNRPTAELSASSDPTAIVARDASRAQDAIRGNIRRMTGEAAFQQSRWQREEQKLRQSLADAEQKLAKARGRGDHRASQLYARKTLELRDCLVHAGRLLVDAQGLRQQAELGRLAASTLLSELYQSAGEAVQMQVRQQVLQSLSSALRGIDDLQRGAKTVYRTSADASDTLLGDMEATDVFTLADERLADLDEA